MGKIRRVIAVIVFVSWICVVPAGAGIFPSDPVYRRAEFKKAFECFEMQRIEKGRRYLENLVKTSQNPEVRAAAKYFIGCRFGSGDSKQIFRQIVQEYPGTRFSYASQLAILTIECNGEPNCTCQKFDDFNSKQGYPRISDILNSKSDGFNSSKVNPSLSDSVADTYWFISSLDDSLSLNDKLKIYCFVRAKFPKYYRRNIVKVITMTVFEMNGITHFDYPPSDKSSPVISAIASHDGLIIGNRQPKIEFELTDGDVTQSQVDLRKLVFTLDGNDLTDDMQVRSHINTSGKYDKKDPRKHTFERLRIWYTPPIPLSTGKHTVYVKAVDSAGNASEARWKFRVK